MSRVNQVGHNPSKMWLLDHNAAVSTNNINYIGSCVCYFDNKLANCHSSAVYCTLNTAALSNIRKFCLTVVMV